MFRPLDWLVVALSIAFLLLGRSMTERVDTRMAGPDAVLEMPSAPALQAQVLPFEPAHAVAVPAGVRRERNIEFGYVRLDSQALP
jgi:hypothetical protein